jgi:hypothetical protein
MKVAFVVFIFVLLFSGSVFALSDSRQVSSCLRDCNLVSNIEKRDCSDIHGNCRLDCAQELSSCKVEAASEYVGCKSECSGLDREEKRICMRECSNDFRDSRVACSSGAQQCRSECKDEKTICEDSVAEDLLQCRMACEVESIEEEFNFEVSENDCSQAGGFYQQLCKGVYFGIVCSQHSYCHCDGFNEYSCPEDYYCEKDFGITVRGRGQSLPGWKSLLGQDLGDVGLCAVAHVSETVEANSSTQ